ncbi:MAG TPA: hypothetical protein VFZ66_13935 [Herpetosiphonaceae bacterium]
MPESFHDRQWRLKDDATAPDPATRNEIQLAALGERLGQIPLPVQLVKPANGWDTSFDLDPLVMTNPDLAANGWTISLTHSPYTVLTRAGDVRWLDHLWGAAPSGQTAGVTYNYPPAAGTYYSTLFGGRLLLQLPGETDISIWRATSNAPSIYSAGIGGGSTHNNMRWMYMANGAPGAAGVTCAWINDGAAGVTAVAAGMGVQDAGYGAQAVHYAMEAWASQVGHATGRYMRANCRPLFGHGAGGYLAVAAVLDTQHGNGIYANTSRCAVRLRSGPITFHSNVVAPVELFYIRRRPHRAAAYW